MTATINETLPAVQCTPWCEDRNGHTDAWHPDDQHCCSAEHRVTLSRMPLLTFGEHRWLDNVRVYLGREREGSPYVHLGRDTNQGAELSMSEARELRDALTDLLVTASIA